MRNGGLCRTYQGSCSRYLNSSARRFINSSLGFNETEKLALKLSTQVKIVFQTATAARKAKCEDILQRTVCFFVFPLCSPNEKRLDYCREDCAYLFDICGNELNKLVGAGKAILHGKLSGIVYHFDDCNNLQSKQDSSKPNATCTHLPFVDIPEKQEVDATSDRLLIIIIAAGVPVVVLLFILCGFHCRTMNRNRLHSIHYENSKDENGTKRDKLSHIVSMRDRIREWRIAPSELLELTDICKSRGMIEIAVDDIEYLKDLGSGQYGLVFQGRLEQEIEGETSRIVAVKTLREGSSQDAIREFCQEVNIMSTFCHPNVVKLIGVSLGGEPYCMIFEFVELGDLASFLRNCSDVTEESKSAYPKLTVTDQLGMALQIASGMKYISSIHCVHRDLAARNCLVGRGLVVKISDFGLSRDICVSEYYRMDKTRMLPVRWLPPEAFVDGKFTTYSDVYSYGVLLWEIFTFAKLPYEDYDNNKTMELIMKGALLSKPKGCPSPVYDIMLRCWKTNPEKRILFPDIINELCSLDDFGQRFQVEDDEMMENLKVRVTSNGKIEYPAKIDLPGLTNRSFNAYDEQPINVERLPVQQKPRKPDVYTKPLPRDKVPDAAPNINCDGVVAKSGIATVEDNRGRGNDSIQLPRAVHSFTPPAVSVGSYTDVAGSSESHESVDGCQVPIGPDEHQETYDVPPTHQGLEDEETYSLPQITRQGQQEIAPEDTYDVPSHTDGLKETYDVPPTHDEPQETYDIPSGCIKRPLMRNGTSKGGETYDVPPEQDTSTGIYQNSPRLLPKNGQRSVSQSPSQKRRGKGSDQHLAATPSLGKTRHSYENVDFNGRPLITS